MQDSVELLRDQDALAVALSPNRRASMEDLAGD